MGDSKRDWRRAAESAAFMTAVSAVLKLVGGADWPWLLVLSPVWACLLVAWLHAGYSVIRAFADLFDKSKNEDGQS